METKSSKLGFYISALLFLAMTLSLAAPTQVVLAIPATAIVYDAIPNPLAPNYRSVGFEATSTSEFGDYVHLAGTNRILRTVTVTMSDWALYSDYSSDVRYLDNTATWPHPITLNIYNAVPGTPNTLGSLLGTVTQTFAIPWRPADDLVNCPGDSAWFSGNVCYHGYAFNITFDMSSLNVTLPDDVIVGVAYNTADYGTAPIHAPGPYNSLNVGIVGSSPTVGTNDTDRVFLSSTWAGAYYNPVGGIGIFREDTGWTSDGGNVPIQITAVPPPSDVYVNLAWGAVLPGQDPDGLGLASQMGYDAFTIIQDGVNAVASGGTVNVAAGTYVEQLTINKALLLGGEGPGTTIVQSPDTLTTCFTTKKPIICVNGADANITGLTVDGAGKGNGNSQFIGIAYYNAGGTVNNNHIIGMRETPLSGGGNGVSMYANNADSTARTLNVANNTMTGYEKNGMALAGNNLTVHVTGNDVSGAGTITTLAQNGIQLGYGAGGNVTGNTVSGNAWTGTYGGSNDPMTDSDADGAAGILLYQAGAGVEVDNNTLNENQFGVWSVATPSLNIHDNTITGLVHTGNAYPTAIAIWSADQWTDPSGEAGTMALVINNTLEGHDYGLLVRDYLPGAPTPSVGASGNSFTHNGVQVASTVGTIGIGATLSANTFDLAVTVDHLGSLVPFIWSGIQDGVDAAVAGDTVNVAAGTYSEDLTINKSLTLLGPNSAINPNTGTRVAEALLHPATSNPDPAVCTVMAYLSVSNITIKGFTFDGDNPSLNSGIMIGTADVDACEIMAGYEGMGNIVVENNTLKNSTYSGIDFYNFTNSTATSGNYIRYNLFKDIGETTYNWGVGVLIYNNFYADITDNVFTGMRTGIQTGNFSAANPGTTGNISNNEIGAWRLGIFHNLAYSNASALTLVNNTITAENYPGATKWNGILLSSIGSAVNATVSGNIISIPVAVSGSRTPTAGYNVWNVTTSAPITINGGSVTGGDYGVWVNNFEGYASDAGNTSIIVDGVSISGTSIAGINVWDSASNTNNATVTATLNNNVITTSALGVQISGSDATSNGTCNQISGNTAGLNNTTAALLIFEKNWWGSASGPSGSGLGSGDTVSANVDYKPWNTDTTCNAFTSNIAPVANAQSVSTTEDTAKAITLTGTDADSGTLTYSVVAGPSHGTLTGTAPALTYTPVANYNGSDSFTFKVNDGTADSNIATVSLTVIAVNNAPIITEGASVNVNMDVNGSPTPFNLTLNATDANGDILTWSINTAAGHGTASASGTGTSKDITYTPALDYIGSDSFVVQVSDGNGGTDTIIVNVTITAVEPPTFILFLPIILR